MREKNRYIYEICRKDKARTAKVHSKADRSKERKVEECR